MSVVVRTPEGKIKLYCKGAVSTRNNFGPLSFEDRCVSVWPCLSTLPLRLCSSKFAAIRQSALEDSLVSQRLVTFQCSFNRIQWSLSGYKTNRCTWTVLWSTWKILPKRASEHSLPAESLSSRFILPRRERPLLAGKSEHREPCWLNLSSIFIYQSKAQVHSERSHFSWRDVLCYLATAGSVNFLRWVFADNRRAHLFFAPKL